MLETRLLAGHTGYDVVVPSATFLQRQISAGVLLPLDPAKLANLKNLSPEIEGRLASYDPGNRYAVDYMWFTTGIAYNAAKAKERLGEAAIASWDVVFKPELLRRFADCGIYVLDSPEDMFTVALRYLKLDPNSKNLNDLRRAADLLATMRKSVPEVQLVRLYQRARQRRHLPRRRLGRRQLPGPHACARGGQRRRCRLRRAERGHPHVV